MKISLHGFSEMDNALGELTTSAAKGVLRRALKNAAQPMADKARSLAPDDVGTNGYDLKSSIVYGTKLSKRQASLHRKIFKNDKSSVEGFVGAGPLIQATTNEFGTSPFVNGGRFAGTLNPGVAPQPFMRPAFDSEGEKTVDRIGDEIKLELDKAVARAKRKAARLGGSV
ncbi:MAG: HK97-gp10 family putative phage morphogenesis protein [Ahrensia sp.]|nr:HK97-gp10 family putative phage morphogenesis protein [Ahrensia sp.]